MKVILPHLRNYPQLHLLGRRTEKSGQTQTVYVPEVFPIKEKGEETWEAKL